MVGKIYRNIIVIQLIITILSLLGSNIDNMIVGKFLNAEALAACGLVMPVVQLTGVLSGIITTGIKTVCSRSIGEGNRKKANDQISSAALFSLIVFSAACILGYVFIDQIAGALTNGDSELFELVKDYMLGYLLVIPSLGLLSLFIYILQMNNQIKYCAACGIAFIVVNVALDLVSVFVLKWGLFGIGLSTSISYFCMIGILVIGYLRAGTTLRISLKVFKLAYLGDIFKNGLTNAIAKGSSMIIKVLVNAIVLQSAGTDALAAVTVIVSFAEILTAVAKAIAYCTDMTSGMFYGERNVKELINTVRTFVKYSIVINACITAVVAVFSQYFVLMFLNETEVAYPLAVSGLRLFSFSIVFFSISDCFVYFCLGIKKPVYSYVLALLINLSLGLFSVILIPIWMVNGAAIAYDIGYISVFIFILVVFSVRNKSNPFKPRTYLILPDGFEIPDEDVFERLPENEKDVISMSKEVAEFCKSHNSDSRTSLALSLAIEELGVNIFEYGIKNRKRYLFEIRVVYDRKKDMFIARTRDDCYEFNPVKYLEMHENDDKASNLGLRLVLNMAKDSQYCNTMGLNNLVVSF